MSTPCNRFDISPAEAFQSHPLIESDPDTFEGVGPNVPIDLDNVPYVDLLQDLWDQHGDIKLAMAAWMERLATYTELREQYDVDALDKARSDYKVACQIEAKGNFRAGVDKRTAQRIALLALVPQLGLEATARYVDEPFPYVYSLLFNGRTETMAKHLAAEPLLREGRLSWTAIGREVGLTGGAISTLAAMLGIPNPISGKGGCHTYSAEQRDEARELWAQGWGSAQEIADKVGVPITAVRGWCRHIKTEASEAAKHRRQIELAHRPRQKKDHVPKHGTRQEYAKWKCRCEPCCSAESAYQMEQRRKRKQPRPDRVPQHGRRSEYLVHGCRCEPCTEANAKYRREHYAAKKAAQS